MLICLPIVGPKGTCWHTFFIVEVGVCRIHGESVPSSDRSLDCLGTEHNLATDNLGIGPVPFFISSGNGEVF